MKFHQTMNESVIFNPILREVLSELKKRLFASQKKITKEIEANWEHNREINSITLMTISEIILEKYNIHVSLDNDMEADGKLLANAFSNPLLLNLNRIAKTSGLMMILKGKGNVAFIDDFLISVIITIEHEVVHLFQFAKRAHHIDLSAVAVEKILKKYSKDYYNNKDELMAYAAEIISELKAKGYSKEETLDIINTGTDSEGMTPSDIYAGYRDMKSKLSNWKTFMKYFYQYIDKHWKDL